MLPLLVCTVLLLYLFHELYWKRRNLPSGPMPLPFFGNIFQMRNPAPGYECFRRLRNEYGPVFTFWMGSKPMVMIASYEKLKETFVQDGDTYVDKPDNFIQLKLRNGQYGVLDSNGEVWRDQRRFALTVLRDLGLGKDMMQEKILLEITELQKEIDEFNGVEFDLPKLIDRSVGNVINLTLFGYRFDRTKSDEFAELKSLIDSQRETLSHFKYFLQFQIPVLEKIMPGESLSDIIVEKRRLMDDFFWRQIQKHRAEVDYEEVENTDYVEAFLKEQRRREEDGDKDTFSDMQLIAMCFDLWLAGLVTTSATLTWGFSYYLHHPEVRERIQKELDTAIGDHEKLVTMSDKNNLPYLSAFVSETQRCLNLLPINLPHITTKDTVIDGCHVAKGTTVNALISAVMVDDRVFPDPYRFDPERFLENGKAKKVDELVPFSIGKRQCLGEGLARMELFLFFANVFNRYDISTSELPDIDKSKGNVVLAREFRASLKRKQR